MKIKTVRFYQAVEVGKHGLVSHLNNPDMASPQASNRSVVFNEVERGIMIKLKSGQFPH